MKFVRALILLFSIFVFKVVTLSNVGAASNPYLVIDAADGSIISAHKESDKWFPASLTKLMSAYVTMKAISKGEIGLGSPVRISKQARNMPPSRMGYKTGTLLRIDTALKIIIVKSANDVSVALAEAVSGSVENFVEQMNLQAANLGMINSHFSNSNGLHDRDQVSSARDLAILSRQILLEFPQYASWFATPAIKTPNKKYYSYNLLLERFSGTNGMKTGFVCASGYNMVASAKRDGRTLIAVVLGEGSQTDRAILAARLLTHAFSTKDLPIGNIFAQPAIKSANPKNMRPVLCTKKARETRYEPGAGMAVVKSKFLNSRIVNSAVLPISIGGISDKPSLAYAQRLLTPSGKIPVPTSRPRYTPPTPIDGLLQNEKNLRGTIPVPAFRPRS